MYEYLFNLLTEHKGDLDKITIDENGKIIKQGKRSYTRDVVEKTAVRRVEGQLSEKEKQQRSIDLESDIIAKKSFLDQEETNRSKPSTSQGSEKIDVGAKKLVFDKEEMYQPKPFTSQSSKPKIVSIENIKLPHKINSSVSPTGTTSDTLNKKRKIDDKENAVPKKPLLIDKFNHKNNVEADDDTEFSEPEAFREGSLYRVPGGKLTIHYMIFIVIIDYVLMNKKT